MRDQFLEGFKIEKPMSELWKYSSDFVLFEVLLVLKSSMVFPLKVTPKTLEFELIVVKNKTDVASKKTNNNKE